MLKLLRSRRWQSFTVLVLVAIVGFGLLSQWQWSRADEKRQDQRAILEAQEASTEISQTSEPWQRVQFTGQFDASLTQIVRQRPMRGANGVWVLTPLRTSLGEIMWVNRGWVPAARSASDLPDFPPPPPGEVNVEGFWVPFENAPVQPGLPPGMIAGVSAQTLPFDPSYPGFIHAQEPTSTQMLSVGPPDIDENQNISYAMQWLAFAFIAIGGWWFMLRREAQDQAPVN